MNSHERRLMNSRNSSQGVALVSVLLLVAIATVIAVSMVRGQQASVHATRGFLERGQAMQYALGGEELARQLLHKDFTAGKDIDHLAEDWAAPDLQFDFAEGEVLLKITDLQGRLNINGLSADNKSHQATQQRLANLAATVGADASLPEELQDWLDPDDIARAQGAEDYHYLGLEPPYRTASVLLAHVSEAGLVASATKALHQQIAPALSALPDLQAALNINTAPPLALQSLTASLSASAARSLAERRLASDGFESVEDFLRSPELAGFNVNAAGLGVESAFFEARIIARYQDRYSYLTSLIWRHPDDGSIRVLRRDFSRNLALLTNEGTDTSG